MSTDPRLKEEEMINHLEPDFSMNNYNNIAVVGAGTMGSGICQVFAASGRQVFCVEPSESARSRARSRVEKSLIKLFDKGLIVQEPEAILKNLHFVSSVGDLPQAIDLAIEAVPEQESIKTEVFSQLDQHLQQGVVLATNTSSLSVSQLAQSLSNPERFVGLHFFNPPALMPLVEVVQAPQTQPAIVSSLSELLTEIGKTPIVTRDTPGFVVNRLLIPYLNESAYAVYEGVADVATLDKGMKLGANMPIGPLALLDMIGLDVVVAAAEVLHQEFGDTKYRVCPLLRQLVRAGYLGRKSGRGFYDYSKKEPTPADLSGFRA